MTARNLKGYVTCKCDCLVLKNVQQTIIKLKVMLKETSENRYTEKLHEDIDKLLKSCAPVNRAAEEATIDKKQ